MVKKSKKVSKKKNTLQHAHKIHLIYGVAIIAVLLILVFAFVIYGTATGEAYKTASRARAAYYGVNTVESSSSETSISSRKVQPKIPLIKNLDVAKNQLVTLDSKDMQTVSEIKQKFKSLGGLGKVMVKEEICDKCATCFENDEGINYLVGSPIVEIKNAQVIGTGQDLCIPGSGSSGAMYKEYYCENGKMTMKMGKCADTGAGTSCNAEKTACAPECTTKTDCGMYEVCITNQCANIYTDLKCNGGNVIEPGAPITVDNTVRGEVTLTFGGYQLTKNDVKSLSAYYNMQVTKFDYPFKDTCVDGQISELLCSNYWGKAFIKQNLNKDLPYNSGMFVLDEKYNCPDGTSCFEGTCKSSLASTISKIPKINKNVPIMIK